MNGEAQGAVPSKKYSVNDFSQKGDIMEYNDKMVHECSSF